MTDVVLSQHQEECCDKAFAWVKRYYTCRKPDGTVTGVRPWFRIDGGAGTGKTTIIQTLVRRIADHFKWPDVAVQYVAPTGKAAQVMARKGCPNPTTIHKKIYNPKGNKTADKRDLEQVKSAIKERETELEVSSGLDLDSPALQELQSNDPTLTKLRAKLDELEAISQPLWAVNEGSDLVGAKLLVLSEASMVDDNVAMDLLKFNVPILLEGDPGQLPPVFGKPYFMKGSADFTLTEIHRQAKGSPIIEMARLARMGTGLKLGSYGDGCECIRKLPLELALQADQIIVGRNKTRHAKNEKMRLARGFLKPGARPLDWFVPRPGEKLICLRNDNELGLMNGQLFRCESASEISTSRIGMDVADEDSAEEFNVRCHAELLKGNSQRPLPAFALQAKGVQQFDYGYVITCHKAQGSQWDFVVVYDQSKQFPEWRAWLYTALTRAAKRLIVVHCDNDD